MLAYEAALRIVFIFRSAFVVYWFKLTVDEHVVFVHVVNFGHWSVN
jgi:hypothetical protein